MNLLIVKLYKVHNWTSCFPSTVRFDQPYKNYYSDHFNLNPSKDVILYQSSQEKINGMYGHRYEEFSQSPKGYEYIWVESEYFKKLLDGGLIEKVFMSKADKAKFLLSLPGFA